MFLYVLSLVRHGVSEHRGLVTTCLVGTFDRGTGASGHRMQARYVKITLRAVIFINIWTIWFARNVALFSVDSVLPVFALPLTRVCV